MKEKDLDETKPIKVLSDLTNSRSDKYEKLDDMETRSEKYEDILIEDLKLENNEIAEEALAEKNILKAEEILAREKDSKNKEKEDKSEDKTNKTDSKKSKKEKKKVDLDEDDDEITEDDGLLGKLIVKFKTMSKKKRTALIVIFSILLLLIIFLVIFLILKGSGTPEKPAEKPIVQEEETAPVIVDNYYYKKGKLYLLAEDNSEIGSYDCENKDDKLCYVSQNDNIDTFDINRLVDAEGKDLKQRLPIYENNYVFIFDNKNEDGSEVVLYSISEEKELGRYTDVKAYADNYIVVQNIEGNYGLLQIQNGVNEIIAPQYTYLGMIDGQNNLVAKNKNGYVIIDKKNKVQSSQLSSSYKIKNYNDSYVIVLVSDKYNIYDYEGNLVKGEAEFATAIDKYVAYVVDGRLYFTDEYGIKYTENGVKLNTTEYVKTYVYDSNDQLTETKRSFDLTFKDGIIEVGVYNAASSEPKITKINTYEGLVNQTYEYVNYFAGKLYFYSDLEKTSLIGFYNCKNENIINSADASYNTCFLAKDNVTEDNDMVSSDLVNRKSMTPIINNKYVFIADGSNNVVLYDLVTKTSLSDYSKVNTFTSNNDNKVTHYTGDMNVVALNKKGLYGLLTVNSSEVKAKQTFKYNAMEKMGDNYLVLDTSNNWRVLYSNSESAGFTNKIRGYNSTKKYYKVLESGKYYVYDNSATKVSKDGYNYVELYDTYYGAINSNKEVNIYDYTGKKLNATTVKVGEYKYYGVESPAFKVKKDGSDYIVSIWDGSKYIDTNVTKEKEEEKTEIPEEPKEEEEEKTSTPSEE